MVEVNPDRRVCIISSVEEPSLAGIAPIRDMVNLFTETHGHITLVTSQRLVDAMAGSSDKLECFVVNRYSNGQMPNRLVQYVLSQLRNAKVMLSVADRTDEWFFFVGGDTQFIPAILAKLSGKPTHQMFGAASKETMKTYGRGSGMLVPLLSFASKINCALATQIIVYSEHSLREYGLEAFRDKTVVNHRHVIDFERFRPYTPLNEREDVVAFMARLAHEKGILEFMDSLPELLKNNADCKVRIYGTGSLEHEVAKRVRELDAGERVEFVGWIPHKDMPEHLNGIKLLVMPSYAEGLPNVMLEAMACGAAVLMNPVGAIPDVISDGDTGFLMDGNSPGTISKRILEVLEDPTLKDVSLRGRALVEEEFTFERQVEKWRRLFY